MSTLRQLYAGSVALGRLTEVQAKACMANLTPVLHYNRLRDVDVVSVGAGLEWWPSFSEIIYQDFLEIHSTVLKQFTLKYG